MNGARYVFDTNVITAILRREPMTIGRLQAALRADAELIICPVVFYEVYRGLLYKDARKQLAFFLRYVATLTWEDIAREDWEQAALLWADVRGQGHSVQDADLIIAAYTARRDATLVTDNVKHFTPFGVPVENWRR
jgi:predicted nucleic acid-binding protein